MGYSGDQCRFLPDRMRSGALQHRPKRKLETDKKVREKNDLSEHMSEKVEELEAMLGAWLKHTNAKLPLIRQ